MHDLLALSPDDGWAYVRVNERILLIRPPYRQATCVVVDEDAVEKAVGVHGFQAEEQCFPDWQELIVYLNNRVAAFYKQLGQDLEKIDLTESMLEFASSDVIGAFLKRVEHELLPQRAWDHAERLLVRILKLPLLRDSSVLNDTTIQLLEQTYTSRNGGGEARSRLLMNSTNLEKRFPRAAAHYGANLKAIAHSIAEKHEFFSLLD